MHLSAFSALGLTLFALSAVAQVRVEVPAPAGEILVTFTDPSDEGQAARLREMAARLKAVADQLEPLDRIEMVIVHSPRELDQRLGREENAVSGVSYVHGVLFLSPLSWRRNPTTEALEHELEEALVRYRIVRLTGGYRVPAWLEQGLVGVLTKRSFGAATAEVVAARAPVLLAQWESESGDGGVTGYWAVRYLIEERGGLEPVRQLLRLVAQRPDSFLENLKLVYAAPVGELERAWRAWLRHVAEEERKKREGGVREGPLVRERKR